VAFLYFVVLFQCIEVFNTSVGVRRRNISLHFNTAGSIGGLAFGRGVLYVNQLIGLKRRVDLVEEATKKL